MKLALAQINPMLGDVRGNAEKIIQYAHQGMADGADCIAFPELALSGYPPEDLVRNPNFLQEIEDGLDTIRDASKDLAITLIVPTPYASGEKLYNAAHVIKDGHIVQTIKKHYLPNYGVFDEVRVFDSAQIEDNHTVDVGGTRIGVLICEDMWFPAPAAHMKDQGATLLLSLNGSPYDTEKRQIRLNHATARARETGLPVLYLNLVGGQDDLVFDGASFGVNAKGKTLFQAEEFKEHLILLDEGLAMDDERSKSPSSLLSHPPSVYNALCLGLRDYVRKNNFPGVILGLSGGIDSALSATIAVDALGADNVQCVMMPSVYTSAESIADATECADLLGVRLDILPIHDGVTQFKEMLDPAALDSPPEITFENIQSRLRGMILMAMSNAKGLMVLSCGNKSEMATGYATLYGDMCGGFNAVKDVYKTQVYALARWRNEQGRVIPENILTKAPSAELRPGQTDQDTLPPYDVLDDILRHLIEHETPLTDIPHGEGTVKAVWGMLHRAEYKRRQSPPGPRITPRNLGRDRRYPITNAFQPFDS